MNKKRVIGIILISISIALSLSRISLTGAVIGSPSISPYLTMLLIASLLVGASLIFQREEESRYHAKDLSSLMKDARDWGADSLVVDSSGAITYQRTLNQMMAYEGRVYVPEDVKRELQDNKTIVTTLTARAPGKIEPKAKSIKLPTPEQAKTNPISKKLRSEVQDARKLATEYLINSKKHQLYLTLLPYFKGEPAKDIEREYERQIIGINQRIINRLKKDPTNAETLREFTKTYKVSKGDIDVLATAIYDANRGRKTAIVAEDTHLRDAVDQIQEKEPGIGRNIKYLGVRTYEDEESFDEAAAA